MRTAEHRAHSWGALLGAAALVVPLVPFASGYGREGLGGHHGVPVQVPTAGGTNSMPRDQTLYTSGTSTAPPDSFNPLAPTSYTGSQGLLYEPLFLFDPLHDKFVPWLATAGTWDGPGTYRLEVRRGVNWVSSPDGSPLGLLSGADVAYSIRLAMSDAADPYHSDVASVRSVTATGATVTVSFDRPVGYAQWEDFLWHSPVLPQAVWSKLLPGQQVNGDNLVPVSTGPMILASRSGTEACYRVNSHWWAIGAMGLSFKFRYLCDVVREPSGKELSDLLNGRIDWSNELLRGIPNLADSKVGGYGIKTYFGGAPYMLAANTAWLQLDVARAPMSNVDFRRAVAYAIDPANIVTSVYTGTVKTADPTGLLPELRSFIDKGIVSRDGFYHSVSVAKRYLARSGYRGQHLVLEVPGGSEDLINAASTICQQLGKVGIHVSPTTVSPETRSAALLNGHYDMVINTGPGPGPTPWAYFNQVYRLPLGSGPSAGDNTERFYSPAAWALVQKAAATPTTDTGALRRLYGTLEADFLQDLPEIPLWYSGAWFQANTGHWENTPTSTDPKDQFTPVMWPGWLGSTTTVYALAALKPH